MLGPSVFPLQPDGIWNMPYSSRQVDRRAAGEDRYRRSLYTFWRRTSPYPSFMTFDATSREFCTVRRVRTNTPLQALTLLNDPASFEAARALARRMIAAAGGTAAARAALGVKLVLSRAARARRDRTPGRHVRPGAEHYASLDDAAACRADGRIPPSSRHGRWSPTCCSISTKP